MTAKTKVLLAGHRVSVRNPKPGQSKWIQDTSIDLAPGDTLAVTTVTAPPPDPIPVPPPPTGNVVEFPAGPGATPSALFKLAQDLDTSVIEGGGLYPSWYAFGDVLRPPDRPLIIRPAPGEDMIFDGNGSASPPFRFGWYSPYGYITFDGGGRIILQNYRPGMAGLVMPKRIDHAGFNGVRVRDVVGTASIQHSHCVYPLSTNAGGYLSKFWQSNDWAVEGPANRFLNGFHIYDAAGFDYVEALDWAFENLNRAVYAWSGKHLLIAGWAGKNANAGIDASGGDAQGAVKDCRFTNCGPLRQFWPVTSKVLDGGGNTAA